MEERDHVAESTVQDLEIAIEIDLLIEEVTDLGVEVERDRIVAIDHGVESINIIQEDLTAETVLGVAAMSQNRRVEIGVAGLGPQVNKWRRRMKSLMRRLRSVSPSH